MTTQKNAGHVQIKLRKGKQRKGSACYETDQADAPPTNAYISKRSLTVPHDTDELLLTIEELTK